MTTNMTNIPIALGAKVVNDLQCDCRLIPNRDDQYLQMIIDGKRIVDEISRTDHTIKPLISTALVIANNITNGKMSIDRQSIIRAIDQYSINNQQYQQLIKLWGRSIKVNNEQMTTGAIPGGSQGGIPANNTTGIAIPLLPLTRQSIVTRSNRALVRRNRKPILM